jgi:hypothetical protein
VRTASPLFASFAPLLFLLGCGLESSQAVQADAGPRAKEAGSSACGDPPSNILCEGCNGSASAPLCRSGGWQCPPVPPCALPPPDTGTGCSGPPPSLGCADPCSSGPVPPVCLDDTWQCQYPGGVSSVCPVDAGADANVVAADAGPRLFACGALTCDGNTSECRLDVGGPPLADGGSYVAASCVLLPSTCAGSAPTCACVQALHGAGCGCTDTSNDVVLTCDVP